MAAVHRGAVSLALFAAILWTAAAARPTRAAAPRALGPAPSSQGAPASIDSYDGLRALAPTADDLPGFRLSGERTPAGGPPAVTAAYTALWLPQDATADDSGAITVSLFTFDSADGPDAAVMNFFANTQASDANQDPAVQLVDLGIQGVGDEDDAVYRSDGSTANFTLVFQQGRVYGVVRMVGPGAFASLNQVVALAVLIDGRIAAVPQ